MKKLLLIFMAVALLFTSACTSAVVIDDTPDKEGVIIEKEETPEEIVPEVTPETVPEEKEEDKTEVAPQEKPEEKPEVKPEVKPEEKPELKPEEKPEEKPQEKPVEVPEQKPEEKPAAKLEGTLPEIIDKIYAKQTVGEIALGTITQDMMDFTDAEVLNMYTGISDTSLVKEVAVSEAMMGSIPYSLVLVRVNDEAKANEVAQMMHDNIDTRKWICVVADDLKVAVYGDVVMLIMVGTNYADTVTAQQIVDAFKGVCGGTLTKVIG